MRRVIKFDNSEIINKKISYKDGDNDGLREALATEQNRLCAYTETYLGASDDAHIEHFNPTLKKTPRDSYTNWFLVKALWNTRKSTKWEEYQPILSPTAEDLEDRILYIQGNYVVDWDDEEATHLFDLLNLGNERLAEERKRYIKRLQKHITGLHQNPQQYIDTLLAECPEDVYFIRAIQEELNVTVNFDLLKTK
ncbi:hypothetical protein [Fibrella aquatilis]|uniref:Uncharacterized protein n=1 Tax=Fibrella aquatilis TaxID=2817059 RepID=A0A939G3Z4_9BACT|nr:hypothetical protein [Fibrella aquatilis]MBO0930665.1 hypothetical protein [Fibrella aquatilis]